MGFVLKADGSVDNAYVELDLPGEHTEVWVTWAMYPTGAAVSAWTAPGQSAQLLGLQRASTDVPDTLYLVSPDDFAGAYWLGIVGGGEQGAVPSSWANLWKTCEFHYQNGVLSEFFISGTEVWSAPPVASYNVDQILLGVFPGPPTPLGIVYFNDVKIGTARGGFDLFADDFEDGTLDAWSLSSGEVSVVDDADLFTGIEGIVWAPDSATLDVNPDWVRLDTEPYRLATGFQIVRGRTDLTDKTVTGTATVTFRDTEGILDPTNLLSPFWDGDVGATLLDPMKQAAIALHNPVTDEWHTLFRGFVGSLDHQLAMFTDQRGFDNVTWQLVDAFDFFANVILTHGVHGDTPSPTLSDWPNIYYHGGDSSTNVGSGLPDGYVGAFCHVDDRIVQLLDDAGWPGTGNSIDVANLRNIFSGNVSVQGVIYSRKDALLSALFDAADAEFPGVGNVFVSKDGVVTFHGRFARFFPERPGYGINHWYVGSGADAALDPTVAPLAGQIRFYRSKDDVLNHVVALPQGVDETDGGVVPAEDTGSIATFGFRSENFDNLLTFAGHDEDDNPTTAVEECNLFAAFYVDNFAQPTTRIGTLRFVSRSPDAVGAPALWDLLCRAEIGDLVTVTTEHPGGVGFNEDFYIEQIRYTVEPGRLEFHTVTMELEVSPAALVNPFGNWDDTA